jgi:hypothetical protein
MTDDSVRATRQETPTVAPGDPPCAGSASLRKSNPPRGPAPPNLLRTLTAARPRTMLPLNFPPFLRPLAKRSTVCSITRLASVLLAVAIVTSSLSAEADYFYWAAGPVATNALESYPYNWQTVPECQSLNYFQTRGPDSWKVFQQGSEWATSCGYRQHSVTITIRWRA